MKYFLSVCSLILTFCMLSFLTQLSAYTRPVSQLQLLSAFSMRKWSMLIFSTWLSSCPSTFYWKFLFSEWNGLTSLTKATDILRVDLDLRCAFVTDFFVVTQNHVLIIPVLQYVLKFGSKIFHICTSLQDRLNSQYT